jgi:hypothetical protein
MWLVDAAPHLLDDALLASPELALVDSQLAARLRAESVPDDAFRPRLVDRGDFDLRYDTVVVLTPPASASPGEPAELDEPVGQPAELGAGDDVDRVEFEPPLLGALVEPPLSAESVGVAIEAAEGVLAEDVEDLLLIPKAPTQALAPDSEDADPSVVHTEETPRGIALEPASDEAWDLPDYIRADVAEPPRTYLGIETAAPDSEYPELPDLTAATAALEETDAALRRIREQLVVEEPKRTGPALRRATVVSGIVALGALVAVAVDAQLGLAALPSWLGF